MQPKAGPGLLRQARARPVLAVKVGAVLMASGFGRRFGGNKLLEKVDGVPMVQRAFAALPPALFYRAAVVSACPEILAMAEGAGYLPVRNPGAAEGRAASVRLGLAALGDAEGALFAVCDQPWLRRESVKRLLDGFAARPERICTLGCGGRRGNPAVFPACLFPRLLALAGEEGGSKIMRERPELVYAVEIEDPRELLDVDRPEDLRA